MNVGHWREEGRDRDGETLRATLKMRPLLVEGPESRCKRTDLVGLRED